MKAKFYSINYQVTNINKNNLFINLIPSTMKKSILLILILFVNAAVFSQAVNKKTALKVAENFWKSKKNQDVTKMVQNYAITNQNDTLVRVININDQGFVVVANDFSVSPILAYSTEGVFDASSVSPECNYFLNGYGKNITEKRANSGNQINAEWTSLISNNNSVNIKEGAKSVAPLLTTNWNQDAKYNYYCPASATGPDGKCYVGCVALSMGQLMRYYNYPDHGYGSHSYVHPYFGTLSANFADTTYNWPLMGNTATNANKKYIAILLYHCAVAVNMNFGPDGSGSQTENIVDALKNYYHYRNTVTFKDRASISDYDWIFILKDNLDRKMPVIYSGSGSDGGHAWVCDGYDNSDRFHMNWGWSGSGNGYYSVDSLNSGNGDFTAGQGLVVEAAPYFADYCFEGRVMTDSTRTLGDGSGYSYYWNDTHCDWLLAPTDADKVYFKFTDFSTEEGNDVLNIYDGTTTSAPLIGSYSGSNYPTTNLVANSGKMLLTFSSNSTVQGEGWSAKYWCTKVGEGINENNFSNLVVSPNPASDYITIRPENSNAALTCKIYDYVGKLVTSKIIDKNTREYNVDLSGLNSGMYFITVESTTGKQAGKFIKL